MNAIFLTAAMLVVGMQDIQTSPEAKTQLYVKTTPSGAVVKLDGKVIGASDKDNLFDVTAGKHTLTLSLKDCTVWEREIEVREGEITRVNVELKKTGQEKVLSYVGETSSGQRSFADSGHAVVFQRPADMKSIVAVKLFGARYGHPQPPKEDFHIYLIDEHRKVLEQIAVPYSQVKRGEPGWYTFEFPAVAVPEKFMVAVWFNAEATKGVYVGMDKNATETHSYAGLPDKGFQKVDEPYEWMIRAVVSPDAGKQPTCPKVTTYEDEKAADTESAEAQPEDGSAGEKPSGDQSGGDSKSRTWHDDTGAFNLQAEYAGVEDGKVKLKKPDGTMLSVPLDRLSSEDRRYVSKLGEEKPATGAETPKTGEPAARETRELALDNGKNAGQRSIAGGGHAVKFKVEGESNYVTSVSLFGSRYGMPKPPKENFNVWICDASFKPIATFHFPYASYIRGNADWKSFKIRPTKVPQEFMVCFGFNPQATKGVYVSYDDQKSETSYVGVPNRGSQAFPQGNWLIRCKVEKR
jgi:hypothetical protein